MKLLGIDTATMTASAAIVDGDAVLADEDVRTTTHADELMPLIARLCERAGVAPGALDAIAVGVGPGSFTGLRIGMATAKGIAFAAGRPLWAVSSLAALALPAAPASGALVVPVLDARRGEIYAGFYRLAGPSRLIAAAPERVLPPDQLAAAIADAGADAGAGPAHLVGDALAVYPALAALGTTGGRVTPSAVAVARLALAGDRTDVLAHGAPVYIRPSEAEVKYPDGVPGALRRPRS